MNRHFTLINLFLWAFIIMTQAQGVVRDEKTGKLISFTQGGVLLGNSDNTNSAPFIINTSLNYAFTRNISAGVGAGVEFLRETHLPVTGNILYQFGNRSITPFVMLQAGYQIALESKLTDDRLYIIPHDIYLPGPGYSYYFPQRELDAKGGFMAHPSAGVIFYTNRGFGISVAAGYRYMKLNYTGEEDYKLHIEYNRLSLQLGIIF